jgi:hypothetical protein
MVVLVGACSNPGASPTGAITLTPLAALTATARPSPTVTLTPTSTDTPAPSATRTAIPSLTPTATSTPTVALAEVQAVPQGGYSFRPPVGYRVDVQGAQIGLADPLGSILISLYGSTTTKPLSPEAMISAFLTSLADKGQGHFDQGISHTLEIDSIPGLALDVTGTLSQAPVEGQAIIVLLGQGRYLFGLGLAHIVGDQRVWDKQGLPAFQAIVQSVTFSQVSSSGGACRVATDATYGYSQTNAIKVGGGDFGGPPRETAYLDNLRGPNGERITYSRKGSMEAADTILDIFVISGLKSLPPFMLTNTAIPSRRLQSGLLAARPLLWRRRDRDLFHPSSFIL